ncbi:hypothetical protein NS365_15860 [Aureimonas ureilytica]|uniref:DUF427 domain-containing protein n=1 Tax=Aureimonas ureilytica TaxID=401562 RepID=A0A175RMG4_9HYPH|nr:DUF427 domain-containing protein [Aureimonas ureilytica]KTR04154.1 hypothetical protein NS365_15860 [Aureimonas ureilytica]
MRPKPDPITEGQESVWSFPRPAIAQPTKAHIVIEHRGRRIADSRRAIRTLETSHPPSYYIPSEDIEPGLLRRSQGRSVCEWKGEAVYWDVVMEGQTLERVGWSYPAPTPAFAILKDYIAFYARPFDRCSVDGQIVTPQPGGFYGGWITDGFAGPFKGVAGSAGW